MKYKNTLKSGTVRHIIFKEGDTWYGVALEFNIIEEGDSPKEVFNLLFEAIQGYVETAQKLKMRPMPLNQKPDKEYQELWDKLEKAKKEKSEAPKNVYNFGYTPIKPCAMAY
jgi:predicted RNase H-like HicB family nuclease